jgi:transcriptional regulator with XRE-family HTH domain
MEQKMTDGKNGAGSRAFLDRQFGLRVKHYREKNNLSQKDLANRCHGDIQFSDEKISKIERGKRHCSSRASKILAVALGTTVDALQQFELTERPEFLDRVARVVGSVSLRGVYSVVPDAIDAGDYEPSERARAMLGEVAGEVERNEPHGVVTEMDCDLRQPLIKYRCTDYVTLVAEQKSENRVRPLHAGALLVSKDRCSIFIHLRKRVRILRDMYHTISGNFISRGEWTQQDHTLLDTCIREVDEEIHVVVTPSKDVPILICEERDPLPQHAIMVMWLGVDFPQDQHARMKGSPEGELCEIRFDEIKRHLLDERWVPSGMAQVLVWLGLGAPGATLPFREQAAAICDEILNDLAIRGERPLSL